MTSILDTGKYRPRKDWSSSSIPDSLVEENISSPSKMEDKLNNLNSTIPPTTLPPKPPRRSSLSIGLLAGKMFSDKVTKRRSSIAVSFLGGRRDSHKITKETPSTYETEVKSEKSDASPRSPDSIFSSPSKQFIDSSGEDSDLNNGKFTSFEDSKNAQNILSSTTTTNNDSSNELCNSDREQDFQQLQKHQQQQQRRRRRSSSWQTKIERRRRKNFELSQISQDEIHRGSIDGSTSTNGEISIKKDENGEIIFQRQKRHSWWNIFVPDQFKQRSRRASQDVGLMSRSAESITPSTHRSKSRSVDHGLAAPFDLDSLRSKVEGRFESVDRLSKDGEKKKSSLPTIPTTTYTVGNRDTLTSLAARFDTTPSELTHLNRLNSSFIFPGQQLLVPDKTAKDDISTGSGGDGDKQSSSISGKSSPVERKLSGEEIPPEEKEILDGLRPGSPKPGHIERVSQKKGDSTDPADDPVITQKFLKINVRHITDGQGVVGGVLLVTPNAVMFDPNVSDPLVIEHGPESYGVIAPMELVVNAAIFHDIAHMRVAGGESSHNEKVEIYYPKSQERFEGTQSPGKDSLLVKDETFPELGLGSVETCDDQESICSSNEREGDAFPKAFDRERVTPTTLDKENQSSGSGKTTTEQKKDAETKDTSSSEDKTGSKLPETVEKKLILDDTRTLEERRKSLLDHHWAIPSKDRKCLCNSRRSSDEEGENDSINTADSGAGSNAAQKRGSSSQSVITSSAATTAALTVVAQTTTTTSSSTTASDNDSQLSKQSCYDSGIDIRDPVPIVQPMPTKKVFSDADIVLSSDWVPPRTISPTHVSESPPRSQASNTSSSHFSQTQSLDTGRKKTSSVSFSVDDNDQSQSSQGSDKSTEQNKKNKMLKRLSYPLTWVEGLTGEGGKPSESESAPNTGDSNQSVFSKVFSSSPITLVSELGGNLFLSKTPSEDSGGSPVPPVTPHSEGHGTPGRSSIGTFMRPHSSEGTHPTTKPTKTTQPKLDYRSMVSIDDMPELFVSFDKLIPRPARACPDPPLYLRLRMGKPIGKSIPLPTSVMSYGKNKLRPEYWFSVPKNRVDELYRFVHTWVPHLYGELDEEQIRVRGFELIQHDTEWSKGSLFKDGRTSNDEGEDLGEFTRESWELLKAPYVKIYNIIKTAGSTDLDLLGGEVLSMSTDDYRKASLFATGSFDLDFPIPDLIGQTEILTEEHREKLCGHLPARAEGYSWTLVFSTSQNGFSLNSLYRKMQKLESPILIVIEDTEHNVFGALTSCSLHVSDHFYGTGESLLFKFNPTFKVFHWTGENLYFIKGNPESLSIGAGDGKFGLWLDGDLNQGRSQTCSTYGNEPLAPQEDFVIKTLECWAFV